MDIVYFTTMSTGLASHKNALKCSLNIVSLVLVKSLRIHSLLSRLAALKVFFKYS